MMTYLSRHSPSVPTGKVEERKPDSQSDKPKLLFDSDDGNLESGWEESDNEKDTGSMLVQSLFDYYFQFLIAQLFLKC